MIVEQLRVHGEVLTERHGPRARITERFRRVSFGRLEIDVTVNDPKAYSRPWTVTLSQDLAVDTELLDYHCTDNEKSAERMGGK